MRARRTTSLGSLAVAAMLALGACGQGGNESTLDLTGTPPPTPVESGVPEAPSPTQSPTQGPSGPATEGAVDGAPEVVSTIATGLQAPWGLDFLPTGEAIVTERDTRRVLLVGAGAPHRVRVLGTIDAAAPDGEGGLLGVALSPDFAKDRTAYFYVTTDTDNRVVRARVERGRLGPTRPVLTGIPRGTTHDGGRLEFGPDDLLYVSTGESGEPDLAQDRESLGGKILRITTDGEAAPGNPFDTPVWSLGHRNVQGLAFDDDGRLWASEFGDQTFDELNLIEAGSNYGWPEVEGTGGAPEFVDPQQTWNTDEASPSGLAFTAGHLWMASLKGERLWRVKVEDGQAVEPTGFLVGEYGRMRTVAVAPDGTLWLTTSNRDTRGTPVKGDDRILQIAP